MVGSDRCGSRLERRRDIAGGDVLRSTQVTAPMGRGAPNRLFPRSHADRRRHRKLSRRGRQSDRGEAGHLQYPIPHHPGAANLHLHSAEDFEAKARDIAILWAPMLAGESFHVRLHRRWFKGTLSIPKEERFLDETLLDALETLGTPGRIAFTDPDAILQIETIDGCAGASLWQRDDLQRYPFLGVA